jgi:putative DNA primase/helicase
MRRTAWPPPVQLASKVPAGGIKLSTGIGERCGPCPVCGGTDRFSVNLKNKFGTAVAAPTAATLSSLYAISIGFHSAKPSDCLLAQRHRNRRQAPATAHRTIGIAASPPRLPPPRTTLARPPGYGAFREPVSESNAAGLYLRKRGLAGAFPATLGYLSPNCKHRPAMIAAFGFCAEHQPGLITPPELDTGVHLTRLTMDGGKAPIDPVKIMLGPSAGLPIVLAPANDLLAIDIAEGIENGLLIQADTGAGMWVAGCAGRLPSVAAA